MPSREPLIDIARGIAIGLVVAGHVVRGLADSGVLTAWSTPVLTADRLLYCVHLPAFAFLAGLYVARGAGPGAGRFAGRFVGDRVVSLVYLFVVWSLVQGLIKTAAGARVNTPQRLDDAFALWRPEGQLWFLPFLAAATALVCLVRPWESRPRALLAVGASLVLGVLTWGYDGTLILSDGWSLLPFFVAGCLLTGRRLVALLARVPLAPLVVGCLVLAAAYVGLVVGLDARPPTVDLGPTTAATTAAGVLAAVLGVGAVVGISAALARATVGVLALLGRHSLEIFLAHLVFTAGVRVLLLDLGVTGALEHVVIAIVLGLAGPILLATALRRLRLPWLFAAPSWLRVAGSARPASG